MAQEIIATTSEMAQIITTSIPAIAALGGALIGAISTCLITYLNNKYNEKIQKNERIFKIKHETYMNFISIDEKIALLLSEAKDENNGFILRCKKLELMLEEFSMRLSPLELCSSEQVYLILKKIKPNINKTKLNIINFNTLVSSYNLEEHIDKKEKKQLTDEESEQLLNAYKELTSSAIILQTLYEELSKAMRADIMSHY